MTTHGAVHMLFIVKFCSRFWRWCWQYVRLTCVCDQNKNMLRNAAWHCALFATRLLNDEAATECIVIPFITGNDAEFHIEPMLPHVMRTSTTNRVASC